MWVQEDGIGKPTSPTAIYDGIWALTGRRHSTHTPMPMLLSSRGLGRWQVDTTRRALFDLCDTATDEAVVTSWDDALALHLFVGPTPREAVGRMKYVGRAPRRCRRRSRSRRGSTRSTARPACAASPTRCAPPTCRSA